MGLAKLTEDTWLDPNPDLAARREGFAAYPQGIQLAPEGDAAGQELAAMLGVKGALLEAATTAHEDMCILTRASNTEPYRLAAAAVAWPSDWSPADKIGKPLRALHEPIAGYEEQLATSVDNFMAKLKSGAIYGRANWFISHTPDMRWIGAPPEQAFTHVTPQNAGETLFVRSERQTLRRLPQTGAILFTIGIYVELLGNLTPANQAMLSAAMETLLNGEGDRRGSPHYAAQLKTYVMRNAQ
ncbi:MAG: DUF3445 domain-containing protein [Marinomonas sp.]